MNNVQDCDSYINVSSETYRTCIQIHTESKLLFLLGNASTILYSPYDENLRVFHLFAEEFSLILMALVFTLNIAEIFCSCLSSQNLNLTVYKNVVKKTTLKLVWLNRIRSTPMKVQT
jgi:hypothetical protein